MLNQYFIMDIPLRRGYAMHSPSIGKLFKIIYTHHIDDDMWNTNHDCTEINDAIDKYLKDKLGKATADLCLDYFVELFGDNQINSKQITIADTIAEIVKNRDIIRKKIEEYCK